MAISGYCIAEADMGNIYGRSCLEWESTDSFLAGYGTRRGSFRKRNRSGRGEDCNLSGDFPDIKSKHSLMAKHITGQKRDKLGPITTKNSGFTLADGDSYIDFADVFDPLIMSTTDSRGTLSTSQTWTPPRSQATRRTIKPWTRSSTLG